MTDWARIARGETNRRKSRRNGQPVLWRCRFGFHSLCSASYPRHRFCNNCGKVFDPL